MFGGKWHHMFYHWEHFSELETFVVENSDIGLKKTLASILHDYFRGSKDTQVRLMSAQEIMTLAELSIVCLIPSRDCE